MNLATRGLGRSATQYSALVAAGLGAWPAGAPVAPSPSPAPSGYVGGSGGRSMERDPLRLFLPTLPTRAGLTAPSMVQEAYLPALAHLPLQSPTLHQQIIMPGVEPGAAPGGVTLHFMPPPWLLDD